MATFIVSALLPALRVTQSFKPHVVHAYFAVPTGVVAWLLKAFTGAPYLLSLRGGDVPGFLPETLGTFHRLTAPVMKTVYGGAGAIVANSRGLQELAQRSASQAVHFAPNGIDLDSYYPAPIPRNDGVYRILFVGRLVEQKGLRYLLEALPTIRSQIDQAVELVVVGDGPAGPTLQQQAAELGLKNVVQFTGWFPRSAMFAQYRNADVFAFPSFEEGMPNVVLEAMASGLPIVTTDIYGNQELVSDSENGYLVPPGDSGALCDALVRLARDASLRSTLGAHSRRRAEDYGWRHTARAYLDLSVNIAKRFPSKGRVAAGVYR
jgi:glycosyltransferase involved in cell wall biosynthesis